MSQETDRGADSAGQPWARRQFHDDAPSTDDGSAPEALVEALRRFHSGEAGEAAVVEAFRSVRLLVPLVAHLGDEGDKTQELAIVTVAGPDGRAVLPVFSSVTAMTAWNAAARPVPVDGARVALAAVQEKTDLVVLDPTSDTEYALRRPALWAIGQSLPWLPSYLDPAVRRAFDESIRTELSVLSVALAAGDPGARFAGPELVVRLELTSGLTAEELDVVLARLAQRWAASDIIATRVDSLTVQLVPAERC